VSSGSPTWKIGAGYSSGTSRPQGLQPDTGCVCTVPHTGHIHGSFIIRRLLLSGLKNPAGNPQNPMYYPKERPGDQLDNPDSRRCE